MVPLCLCGAPTSRRDGCLFVPQARDVFTSRRDAMLVAKVANKINAPCRGAMWVFYMSHIPYPAERDRLYGTVLSWGVSCYRHFAPTGHRNILFPAERDRLYGTIKIGFTTGVGIASSQKTHVLQKRWRGRQRKAGRGRQRRAGKWNSAEAKFHMEPFCTPT
jgi:hypothetical protein